jgi:hypothetical protein
MFGRRIIATAALALALAAPALAQSPYPPGPPPPVPALPDSQRQTSYTLSASTCACAVGFQLGGTSTDFQNWVEVWVGGKQVQYNDPVYGWSISSPTGALSIVPRPITDAVLTFNNPVTGTVVIVGAERPRRTGEFNEGVGVPARSINQVFNDLYAILREYWDKLNDVTGRGLFFAPGNTAGPMPSPSTCANGFLAFDSTGLNPVCLQASQILPPGSNVIAAGAGITVTSGGGTTTIAATAVAVTNMSALKALTGVAGAVFVQGYTNVGDLGGGWFVWNSGSTATDNAGTIIQPNAGGTGRWIRFGTNGGGSPVYTPEMFGSPDNGTSDDAAAIRAAMLALSTAGGGVLQLACNVTYHLSTTGSNKGIINLYSGVSIKGCGPSSVLKVANGVTTSGNYYSVFAPTANTNPISNVGYADFTIDANGANNDCSGACYGNAASIFFEYGDNVRIAGMTFLNQAMTQFLELGANAATPTLTNVNIVGNVFENSCDAINAACTDNSNIYLYASNGTVVANSFYNGGSAHGGAIELHGFILSAVGNSINDYFGAFVLAANDGINTGASASITVTGNSVYNTALLANIFVDSSGTFNGLVLSDNTFYQSATGHSYYAIEANNNLSGGTATGLSVTGNALFGYDQTGASGIHLGGWSTATIADNHLNNFDIGIGISASAGTGGFVFGNTILNTTTPVSLGGSHANWKVGCGTTSPTSYSQGVAYC